MSTASLLLARGADIDVVPAREPITPLEAAGAHDLVAWLHARGGRRLDGR